MKTPRILHALLVLAASVTGLPAALILDLNDGATPAVYSNGGGSGFGGTLGGGSIAFDAVGSSLNISFAPGNPLGSDITTIYLNTRSGGFTDADMNDTQDGGRNAISNLGSFGNETFPDMGAPDYGIAIANWGAVLFELTSGNTPGHLNYIYFENTAYGSGKQITFNLSSIGSPDQIDWFAAYVSDTSYLSNESLPASSGLNSGGNPGFGGTGTYLNYNRFTIVPEAGATGLALLAVGLGLARRVRGRRA